MTARVLHLVGSFNQGGSERQATALAILQREKGEFVINIATLEMNGVLLETVRNAGFENIREFPLTSFYDLNFLKQIRSFASFLRQEKIDILHTHDFYGNVFGMAAATLAKTPIKIASKRETGGMRTKSQQFVENIAFRRADAIVVNADAVAEYVHNFGIPKDKLKVIYNGIDLSRFTNIGYAAEQLKAIILVANLRHRVKNIPMFLNAAAEVNAKYPDTRFVIAGEGELKSELEAMTKDLGIAENVEFIGRCMNIPELLKRSFACVLTSDNEGFSNSLIEYMAAGRPVVATNVGGAAEAIIDGVNGFLVMPDAHSSMADRLMQLIEDPAMARKMGDLAREKVTTLFNRETQNQNVADLYRSLQKNRIK